METLLNALGSLLIALVVALLGKVAELGIKLLSAKLKLSNTTWMQTIVQSGIAYAEERAAQYLKANGAKLASSEKLKLAVKYVLLKLPNVTEEEAEQLITTELPKVSLGASGFFASVAAAVQSK